MGALSIWHSLIFLVFLIFAAAFIYPVVRIIRRTGHSGWWVLLWFVPFGAIVGVWILAFARWPAVPMQNQS
jgi:hypothetical protein